MGTRPSTGVIKEFLLVAALDSASDDTDAHWFVRGLPHSRQVEQSGG